MGRLRDVVGIFSLADVNVIEELPEGYTDIYLITYLLSRIYCLESSVPNTHIMISIIHLYNCYIIDFMTTVNTCIYI